jgi:hypothetical protein
MLQILAFILVLLSFLASCSNTGPGIEGSVIIFGLNIPAPGISIEAIAHTDIKEEQARANVLGKTDSSGRFIIKGLLPNKQYEVIFKDSQYKGSKSFVMTPSEGTRMIDKPLIALPVPHSNGVWSYTSNIKEPKEILSKSKLVKVDPIYLYKGEYERTRWAFFIEDNTVINNISATVSKNSILVFKNSGVKDIGMLSKISSKTLYVSVNEANNKVPVNIKDAWYYNISNFGITHNIYGRDFMELTWNYYNPIEIYASDDKQILAITINMIPTNLFCLTKTIFNAKPHDGPPLVGGKYHLGVKDDSMCPKEGIIIQVKQYGE